MLSTNRLQCLCFTCQSHDCVKVLHYRPEESLLSMFMFNRMITVEIRYGDCIQSPYPLMDA